MNEFTDLFPYTGSYQLLSLPSGNEFTDLFPYTGSYQLPSFPSGQCIHRSFLYTSSYQPFSLPSGNERTDLSHTRVRTSLSPVGERTYRPFPYMVRTSFLLSRRGMNLQTFLPTRVRTFASLPSTPSFSSPTPPPPPSVLVPYGSFGDKASLLLIRMLLLSPQFITNVLIVWVQGEEDWAEEGNVLRA